MQPVTVNFNQALNFLENHCTQGEKDLQPFPLQAIIQTLHQAALVGTDSQKAKLLPYREKIRELNQLLAHSARSELSDSVKGMQIQLPQTRFERMVEVATLIPRILFAALLDFLLLPGALLLLLAAACKVNFNPEPDKIKKSITPILLLHGSGFNESEWIIGRQFLKKEAYGSVFSMNYDGLVSNEYNSGIDDYAREKVLQKIQQIQEETGCSEVILIGHSMGAMIAGYVAEHYVKDVKRVISIGSPWQGSPTIDRGWKLTCNYEYSRSQETKRHLQMSVAGGGGDPDFRKRLVEKAQASEQAGLRKYYNVLSTTDYAVPGYSGLLSADPRRQRVFNHLGHYGLVVWPSVWMQVRSWLDEIYQL